MSFGKHFTNLFNKAQPATGSGPPQVPLDSKPQAPPVPTSSKPHPSRPPPAYSETNAPYWHPDFNPQNSNVSDYFIHETGQTGWGNSEAQNYTSSSTNSFCSTNNALVLRAIANLPAPSGPDQFTSARLVSHQTLSRPQGRLSCTADVPLAKGIWPAFWLLPCEPFSWPTDGEVDIMETWNGDGVNHSCLHWGQHNRQDKDKHRVVETKLPTKKSRARARFDFVWDEDEATGQGRMMWYIDSKPVMRASKPPGTRKMRDFRIIINIAMGGHVCQGEIPANGTYEMQITGLAMHSAPEKGWEAFEKDWKKTKEGHTN